MLENQVIYNEYYKEDLAFIHDVGFADYALQSAPSLLKILKQNQLGEGLVVDLGCGSGLPQRPTEDTEYAEVREKESYMFECNLVSVS